MGEVIVVTSGKGGVGKTTTTANLGSALALRGKKVVLIDTDIGLRNLDVVMGLENRIVYDIVDVVEEKCKLKQALIKDKRFKDLFLLPAAQTRDKSAVNEEQMKDLTSKLKEEFDLRLKRTGISYTRSGIAQQLYRPQNEIKAGIVEVVNNPKVLSFIKKYPLSKLPRNWRLFAYMVKFKCYWGLKLIEIMGKKIDTTKLGGNRR